MNISITDAFSRGFDRMKADLFKPFDLNKWFVVGFTAFLAGLMDGHSSAGGGNRRWDYHHGLHEFFNFPYHAYHWLVSHPLWSSLIISGLVLLIAVFVVFTWLSSRGKFMYLDNVVHNRALVSQPWNEYASNGNSLFLWRLVYGFIVFFCFAGIFGFAWVAARNYYLQHAGVMVWLPALLGFILLFLVLAIIVGYINLFLDSFVVPIMYKHKIGVLEGWHRFLSLLSENFFHFILYGLFVFVLLIAVVILVITVGVMTCCIGLILLIIPYIGSVILLPVTYTFRAFSIEYLRQFGPEYDVFGQESAVTQ
jgi:hypothetical protein